MRQFRVQRGQLLTDVAICRLDPTDTVGVCVSVYLVTTNVPVVVVVYTLLTAMWVLECLLHHRNVPVPSVALELPMANGGVCDNQRLS